MNALAVVVVSSLVLTSLPALAAPEVVNPRAVDAICASPFASDGADVLVYREDDDIRAFELRPDRQRFADPPSVFFAPGGRERLIIVDHTLPPESPEARALAKARAEAIDGGVAAETMSCRVEHRKIHELEGAGPGRYIIEGFVADIYSCGFCPARAMCRTCQRDHIALSETRRSDAGLWPLGRTEVLALTGNLLPLRGVRYRLRVAITTEPRLSKHVIPDVEVLALQAVKR